MSSVLDVFSHCHNVETVKPCFLYSIFRSYTTIRKDGVGVKIRLVDIVAIYLREDDFNGGRLLLLGANVGRYPCFHCQDK